ncbi:hydroxysqualene dehydroxylase HpnE [Actinomycetospora chiangmaiensis]|uniref:hydroxysqualene dehydroxylase HpnE n=1 Tax=Actinomycetospora chiangmaiensis TaxID=402650 RepID=UPI000375A4D6|nr:hydroxysqualene dehydroxylase HpnE [Actinomycetospora chiangmaiensis]
MSRVAVLGGGLAGIRAALDAADAGHAVTLLERAPRLGGLAGSFERAGRGVDTGQHVFLRCCTAYRALLDRLAVTDATVLQDRLDVTVLRPGRAPARLRRTGAPAPLHLAASLLRYDPVPRRARVALGRAALALRAVDPADPAADRETFGAWLRRHGQGAVAVRGVWDLIGLPTLNLPADEASLALAAVVFRVGLLGAADAADLGWARVPLGELHDVAARRALTGAGVTVATGTRVVAVHRDLRVTTTGRDGRRDTLAADAVVCALPPEIAAAVLPAPLATRLAVDAAALGTSPIVDVHLRYDRTVLDVPFAAGLDTPVQWVFDRTREGDTGQYLVVSLSAANAYLARPSRDLVATFTAALASLLPRARAARVLDAFVTRAPRATFRPVPGTAAHRPAAATPLPGLALAGAWTDTGWPATMEGAVRSGSTAAALVAAPRAADRVAA